MPADQNKTLGGIKMHSHCNTNLIGLEGISIKKIQSGDTYKKIFVETKPSEQICPTCGAVTKRIHDYRNQTIKDLPLQLTNCFLVLRKRRYICTCGKKFYEHYDFLPRYFHRTSRLTAFVAHELRQNVPLKEVARRTNVSSFTVARILNTISYTRPKLSDSIAIDEFKGNAGGNKFQCIIVDPKKNRVLDILPDRKQSHLISYFKSIPRDERYRVKFFVCDMWKPYTDLARIYFPNAKIIIDKYHFTRQIGWAIDGVRKRLQKEMVPQVRKLYKRSRKLILTRYYKLKDANKQACDLMLLYNDDLRSAHRLKEWFYDICHYKSYSQQRTEFYSWIKTAEISNIPEFVSCAATLRNWAKEILNAFKYGLTNGPTEGFNNKIKVLKRVSYGLRHFERFRNRILHITSN